MPNAQTRVAAERPAPQADRDSAFFWDGLRSEELRLQHCTACGRHRFPPLPACPHCGGADSAVVVSPGRGVLYSWIVVHRAFSDAFADEVPYAIGVIELDEGCRMLARPELGEQPARIGMRLAVAFRAHATWSEARFMPASGDRPADRG